MANENKKVTNSKNKNTKTNNKTTSTAKKTAAKKTTTVKKATTSNKAATKSAPKKKTTTAAKKKTSVAATKKAAKKVVNTTKGKTTTPKKNTQKKVTKKVENKVETKKVVEQPKVVEKAKTVEQPKVVEKAKTVEQPKIVETKKLEKKEDKKISLSTNTLYTIIGLAVLAIVIVLTIVIKPSDSDYKNGNGEGTIGGNNVTTSPADEDIPEDKRKELNSISIDKYLEMLKGDETKVIYIGRPTCGHCVKQKPIMENIQFEYDVEINYLNTDELNDDGINQLISSNEYFKDGFGTPLTLIVKDNEILDKAVGETSKADMVELFKKYSLIK